jgi:hypothetical protein
MKVGFDEDDQDYSTILFIYNQDYSWNAIFDIFSDQIGFP